jgi:hypothetical protein
MLACAKLGGVVRNSKSQEAIEQLVEEAKRQNQAERRTQERHPFFRPVMITIEGPERKCYSAFSREVSRGGIGLLHNMPLSPGKVVISISQEMTCAVTLPTELLWCRPCGEGWYLSGGRFLESANQ